MWPPFSFYAICAMLAYYFTYTMQSHNRIRNAENVLQHFTSMDSNLYVYLFGFKIKDLHKWVKLYGLWI